MTQQKRIGPTYRELLDECKKEGNRTKIFQLAGDLGIPRNQVVDKSQEEICLLISKWINVLAL
jgi:hypothetical protein